MLWELQNSVSVEMYGTPSLQNKSMGMLDNPISVSFWEDAEFVDDVFKVQKFVYE